MGKADDMRRQRELRYEQDQREDAARRKAALAATPAAAKSDTAPAKIAAKVAPPADAEEPDESDAPEASEAAAPSAPRTKLGRAPRKPAGGGAEEQGLCSGCKKQRPLQNGLIANHQKGLGKACSGSRKPPV